MTWQVGDIEWEPTKTLDAWVVMEVPFDGAERPWTRPTLRTMSGETQRCLSGQAKDWRARLEG